MKTITFFGEIGAELFAVDLAAELKAAGKEDILLKFSSIGGSIFEGGDIYNVLADHRRENPGIKMNLEIKSTALSMGSLLAASPVWDEITVEQNTMLMLHNPFSIAIGDFLEMRKTADFLESARDMYAKIYADRSKKGDSEIKNIMSAVTWYFGPEIVAAGFADRLLENATVPQDRVMVMAAMEEKFVKMKSSQSKKNAGKVFDLERAAACFNQGSKKAISVEAGTKKLTKAEFIKKYPEVYQENVEKGIKKERARIKELTAMKARDEYKNIPQVAAVFDKAVAEGTSPPEIQPLIMAALLLKTRDPFKAQAAAEEGPGHITGFGYGREEMIDVPGPPPRPGRKGMISEV